MIWCPRPHSTQSCSAFKTHLSYIHSTHNVYSALLNYIVFLCEVNKKDFKNNHRLPKLSIWVQGSRNELGLLCGSLAREP